MGSRAKGKPEREAAMLARQAVDDAAQQTVVVFRRWRDSGDVVALFPWIDEGNGLCSSYMHVGQHSSASYGHVVCATKPVDATERDVAALRRELESIGYRLCIRSRAFPKPRALKGGAA